MNVLRVTASMDPATGGPPQGIRNSIAQLVRLGISNEVVCCDAPDAAWLGKDSFPVHALGPGKYGFAYTPKLGLWLEENLPRFDAVIVHGLWLWPSVCATRAVAQERARREEQKTGHGLTRMGEDKSERLAADRTGGNADCRMTSTAGGLSSETADGGAESARQPVGKPAATFLSNSKQLRCFVMPHGMLDPWFQRDRSRRVKAVRNWFYWWLVERGVVNSADALLFTCQQELELARTTFGGYRPKRETNVGYGIAEPPAFEPKMQEAFAARCPDLKGRPYLLFLSRVHPKKGVAALVRAYARVRREYEERSFSHGLTRIDEDKSERLAADRTEGNADCRMTSTAGGSSRVTPAEYVSLPDLVIAGPGWDSDYGKRIKELIREQGEGRRERGDPIHAVDMLEGDAKWGALYGCEAFVLPSHQENFGIAVVEALACGKPVLISDQVNIWREIVGDDAGLVGEDTEEGVEKLLRQFLDARRAEGGTRAQRRWPEANLRAEVGGQSSDFCHSRVCETAEGKLTRIDTAESARQPEANGSERLAAGRTGGNADCRMIAYGPSTALPPVATAGGLSPGTADGGPRACYLKRFAIGPAAAKLAEVLATD